MIITKGKISAEILEYGATLKALWVPDKNGDPTDIVLGFDDVAGYRAHGDFFGALVGRYANRIAGASFELNGKTYDLYVNDGPNSLHGGKAGFDKQIWDVVSRSEASVSLRLVSPDGQENYPGTLTATVTYTVTEDSLILEYEAVSDADTICNLTTHSYFNLNGHGTGTIRDHALRIYADRYTEVDAALLPTGELPPVLGTPLDFTEMTRIGDRLDSDFDQIKGAGGMDSNFVLADMGQEKANGLLKAAEAVGDKSGIRMALFTDQPGLQFYSGNWLGSTPPGKGGAKYEKYDAFCLETQNFPDAPHHPNFPSPVLKAGTLYKRTGLYRFSVDGRE